MQVTIGGEPRTLGDFSAYKAFKAMEIVAAAESVWRQVLGEAARFKREYESDHVVELDRTTARRHFRPAELWETVREEGEDGRITVVERPLLQDGKPVVGPDPLAHLSEEDWAASGHKLRLPDSPSENQQTAAMIPLAFRLGREQVLRLLALVVTSNADIERWDAESVAHVDEQLDQAAQELLHRCKANELLQLAAAALELVKEQVAGPFEDLVEAVKTTFASREPAEEERIPPPMSIETEASTDGSPTSPSGLPDASAGSRSSSPTEPASESSLASASG